MAYKLIQLEAGKIVTGEALKQILSETGFTIPTLPPLLPYPAKPDIRNYQPNTPENQTRYYADWQTWRYGPYMEYYARIAYREKLCNDFALVLRQTFLIGLVRRSGITLSTADRYLSFAMVLTGLHKPFIGDPIHWICFHEVN